MSKSSLTWIKPAPEITVLSSLKVPDMAQVFPENRFYVVKGKQTQCKSDKAVQLNGKPERHLTPTAADPEGIARKPNVNINLRSHPNKMKTMNELFIFQRCSRSSKS